jgi:hypothetical protein
VIKVVGDMGCASSYIESDEWIPLKITWEPRPTDQPLYLRVSGHQGGEVELKVDPATGVLVQVIVITAPPPSAEPVDEPGFDGGASPRVPVVDRSPWSGRTQTGADEPESGGAIARVTESLKFARGSGLVKLLFGNLEPTEYLRCGDVWVGVSNEGALVEIAARQ